MTKQTSQFSLSDFTFEKILIESDRLTVQADITSVTTDIDIYENINKPYLTGTITFIDSSNLYSSVHFIGAERVIITLKSTKQVDGGPFEAKAFTKTFYVSKVINNSAGNDTIETITLHLIEDLEYISNLNNVNESYTGECREIIQKISKNYLGKNVLVSNTDIQDKFKVIIPNMTPTEAMIWIRNKATTIEGAPFYLFSTLIDKELLFIDLLSMINSIPINEKLPYVTWESAGSSNVDALNKRLVQSYKIRNTETLFSIINKGLLSSECIMINGTSSTPKQFIFDAEKDMFYPLYEKNKLPVSQRIPKYSSMFNIAGVPFNEMRSRRITQVMGAQVFSSETGINYPSYNEELQIADYKRKIIAKSMNEFLTDAPLTIAVNGADFIDGDTNKTLGNVIRIWFLETTPDPKDNTKKIDRKKSGDYLIFAAKHVFKRERYDVILSCVKLAHYREEK